MVLRYDAGALKPPTRMPNGWLRVDGLLTRTGVFEYANPDGTKRREYRSPKEVFNADSLKTFGLVPVTNNHPPELLTANNTANYAVGVVGERIVQDGDYVRASMQITDARTIADIEAGKLELSCGYACDVLEHAGVSPEGERYDCEQTNIRGNHVAVVEVGRAGPQAKIRLDAGDAVQVVTREDSNNMKVMINGVEYEVTDQVAQAITRERQDVKERLDTAQAEVKSVKGQVDKEKARADAAEESLTAEKKARTDAQDPAKMTERVNARVTLLVQAKPVLAPETKYDSMDDKGIKVAVLGKLKPDLKLDGKSDEYIQARYDIAIEDHAKSNPSLDEARRVAQGGNDQRTDSTGDADADARNRMLAHNKKLGNDPIDGAFKR
jgi:hypothetical protein